jgi:predicted RND superfamily exporter protein|tara:strand:+ start:901 stop:3216 length:2316 start_codon:yes stop_codon:yes gene_type:complete
MSTDYKNEFGGWVIRFRWWIILFAIVLVFAAASGARFLGFSTDYRVFFSKDNPQLVAFETLQNTYTKNDNIMFAVEPKDGNVFSRETLAIIEEITHASWKIPYSIRVDSVTNFQYTWADGDDLVVQDLVEKAGSFTDEQLEKIKGVALAEPLLLNRLITHKSNITGINVTINRPQKTITETPEVVAFAREIRDRFQKKHPKINIYLTGVLLMDNAFNEAGQGDMKSLVPIMYGIVLFIIAFSLRTFWGTLTTTLIMGFSILTGMGLAGWSGILLTPISANAPTIILTLAVADSIHILVTLFYEMRHGKPKYEAIRESLRVNHQPVFITSVTTAIGFLSLNFSDSPPFRDLGNIVAMGVMSAYIYSVFFLPAIMAVLPLRVKVVSSSNNGLIDKLSDWVINNRDSLFWSMMIIIIVLSAKIPQIQIDEKFNEYFDTRYQFRGDNDYVTEHLTGFESIEYSLNAGDSGGVSNPAYLKKVDEFAQWYRKQPGVMYVGTLTDTMKRLNKNMHGDDEAYYRLPEERDLSAQYLLLYELSLPFGLDLNNQINIDKSSTRFTAILESVSTQHALALEKRAQKWLRENAPPEMASHGASPLIMFSHIAKRNIDSMMIGNTLALLLISAILIAVLRSFKLGLISTVPNLVPMFMTFGLWGWVVGEIGLAVSVVAPVALGIIVDDTVHFLSKFRRARIELGKTTEEAIRYSFHTVGPALFLTSLILVCGFLVLTFSGFRMNVQLGYMTTISIIFALLADFLFLPTLIMKLSNPITENKSHL